MANGRDKTIRLYGADGKFKRWIAMGEAKRLTRGGQGSTALMVCEVCGFSNPESKCKGNREEHRWACSLREPERLRQSDPAYITSTEMRVYAMRSSEPRLWNGQEKAVVAKVEAWEATHMRCVPCPVDLPNEYIPTEDESNA